MQRTVHLQLIVPALYFLPAGTDGTGQAITPQLPGLLAAGYDIRSVDTGMQRLHGFDANTCFVLLAHAAAER